MNKSAGNFDIDNNMADNNAYNDNNINGFMNNDTGNPNQPIWSPDDTIYNPNQSYNNANNNAYNTNIISNHNTYANQSYYNANNAREPKAFNREQFQSKLTEQNRNKKQSPILAKIIIIFPFIFFIGIFAIIVLSGFQIEHSINKIVSKYDAAPTASYSDKIKVNAELYSFKTTSGGDDYNHHVYNGGVNGIPAYSKLNEGFESLNKTTVNNSNYMLDTNANMQTMIPARYHHSSSSSHHDGPRNSMSISGTVTNTDTKTHSFTIVFRTAKPDNNYKGVFWETFTLKPGESGDLDDINIAIKNLPLIDIANPKIIDGNYKASSFGSLSTKTKSEYQFDWNTK